MENLPIETRALEIRREMFELYQVGLFFILLLLALIYLAYLASRKRSRSQEIQVSAPDFIEFTSGGNSCLYVATTFADRPLSRITAHGLAFGGRANVAVSASEVRISRVGEISFRIGAESLIKTSKTTAVIDRAVEKDGLVSIRWMLGNAEVESHFRFPDSEARLVVEQGLGFLIAGRL